VGQEIPRFIGEVPTRRFVAILEEVLARLVSVSLVGLTLLACEGYVRRGSTLYADGRYVEAAEVFERTEERLPQSTPREQAEYGLYRGMTLLVLGDLDNAKRWLAYASEVERKQPGTLRSDRRALLDRGWFELERRARQQTPTPATPADRAIATSGPAPEPTPQPDAQPRGVTNEKTLVPH
jgi:hypothetical protein